MIDCERVLREVAARKGAIVYRDGVEMLFADVLNIMLNNLGAAVSAALEVCRNGHEEAVRLWRRDAEACMARILGAALASKKETASKTICEAADKAAASVRGRLSCPVSRQREELDAVVAGVRCHAFLVLAAYGAMLAGAVVVLFL